MSDETKQHLADLHIYLGAAEHNLRRAMDLTWRVGGPLAATLNRGIASQLEGVIGIRSRATHSSFMVAKAAQ